MSDGTTTSGMQNAATTGDQKPPVLPAQWQPIETAPHDRMLLVGFYNSLQKWRSMHAQWRDDLPQDDYAEADDEPAPAGWYEGSLNAEVLFQINPTHWMPLPEPPTGAA